MGVVIRAKTPSTANAVGPIGTVRITDRKKIWWAVWPLDCQITPFRLHILYFQRNLFIRRTRQYIRLRSGSTKRVYNSYDYEYLQTTAKTCR
jgi:hypothetical protein